MKLILRPIITEKSTREAKLGRFTFAVKQFARKNAIKKEIEDVFSVNVLKIFTSVVKGKTHRVGVRRAEANKSIWKKATVQLAKEQKIDLFDVGQQ
ncbi:MAG TPA: 50S ribosomal protein L23 [Candidatus Saccharimonadales bacterium]|nr:50S ribosomal protein L23 [Candidatus Saccharimonadales bacterium]